MTDTDNAKMDRANDRVLANLKAINESIPGIYAEQAAIKARQRTILRNQKLAEYAGLIIASVAISQLINALI